METETDKEDKRVLRTTVDANDAIEVHVRLVRASSAFGKQSCK